MANPIIIGGGSGDQPSDPKVPHGSSTESSLWVDEGWKQRAQKEKEGLAASAEKAEDAGEDRPLPPASFLGLIEEFAVRAMLALGQLRDPSSNEVYIDLDGAKYVIDTLSVLEEKTKNNLDASEAATLKQVLHNLRLTFVHVSKAASSRGPAAGPGGAIPIDPGSAKPGPKIVY